MACLLLSRFRRRSHAPCSNTQASDVGAQRPRSLSPALAFLWFLHSTPLFPPQWSWLLSRPFLITQAREQGEWVLCALPPLYLLSCRNRVCHLRCCSASVDHIQPYIKAKTLRGSGFKFYRQPFQKQPCGLTYSNTCCMFFYLAELMSKTLYTYLSFL